MGRCRFIPPNTTEKGVLAGLLAALLSITLIGCAAEGNAPPEEPTVQDPPAQVDTTGDESSSGEAQIAKQLESYAPQEYISVYASNGDTRVILYEPALGVELLSAKSDNKIPENWEDLRESIVDAAQGIVPLEGTDSVILFLQDAEDGNIYLTVFDGSVAYDAFDGSVPASTNDPTITLAEFNQIASGMTYDEVVAIVGGQGQIISQTDLGLGAQYATVIYMWEGEGFIGANANVYFQGGVVTSKAQFGLE